VADLPYEAGEHADADGVTFSNNLVFSAGYCLNALFYLIYLMTQ
jgi:hypothetical protein